MKRKIIHVSVVPEGDTTHPHIVALCDDGTLWMSISTDPGKRCWTQYPEIPQPGTDAEPTQPTT